MGDDINQNNSRSSVNIKSNIITLKDDDLEFNFNASENKMEDELKFDNGNGINDDGIYKEILWDMYNYEERSRIKKSLKLVYFNGKKSDEHRITKESKPILHVLNKIFPLDITNYNIDNIINDKYISIMDKLFFNHYPYCNEYWMIRDTNDNYINSINNNYIYAKKWIDITYLIYYTFRKYFHKMKCNEYKAKIKWQWVLKVIKHGIMCHENVNILVHNKVDKKCLMLLNLIITQLYRDKYVKPYKLPVYCFYSTYLLKNILTNYFYYKPLNVNDFVLGLIKSIEKNKTSNGNALDLFELYKTKFIKEISKKYILNVIIKLIKNDIYFKYHNIFIPKLVELYKTKMNMNNNSQDEFKISIHFFIDELFDNDQNELIITKLINICIDMDYQCLFYKPKKFQNKNILEYMDSNPYFSSHKHQNIYDLIQKIHNKYKNNYNEFISTQNSSLNISELIQQINQLKSDMKILKKQNEYIIGLLHKNDINIPDIKTDDQT